ncbi:oxidoreductase-like protein [Phlebopus sp. FC_14]|nr:oxidoreductase-like protein [Phlebopus sp. FC_14]
MPSLHLASARWPILQDAYWVRRMSAASSAARPARGGQNLSDRYRRLENSVRGTNARAKQISAFSGDTFHAKVDSSQSATVSSSKPSKPDKTIAGFVIPPEPRPPADDECCMSGCAVCVYDLYEESLAAYKESITALRSSLSVLSIPESDWPQNIQARNTLGTPTAPKRNDVVLSAFEEMERALKEKREKRAAVEADS